MATSEAAKTIVNVDVDEVMDKVGTQLSSILPSVSKDSLSQASETIQGVVDLVSTSMRTMNDRCTELFNKLQVTQEKLNNALAGRFGRKTERTDAVMGKD